MAQVKRKRKSKRKGKIKFSSYARIIERNDATRVLKSDTTRYPIMATQVPRSLAPTFKIKIKRKGS